MRKLFGIMFSVMLLVPGIKISLDRHFCCGKLADVKISISGKPATCGMEEDNHPFPGSQAFISKCCEDRVTILNLDYRYYPETPFYKNIKITRDIPAVVFTPMISDSRTGIEYQRKVLPPGRYLPLGPGQAEICLFRI